MVGLIAPNDVLDISIQLVDILTDTDQLLQEEIDINEYILENGTTDDFDLSQGIYINKTTELDSGRLAGIGEDIEITYVGTFLNGEPFDGTFGNETFPYTFGDGQVITGLDLGVGELFFGESAIIVIPSGLAYSGSAHVMPPLIRGELVTRNVIPAYAGTIGAFEPLVFDLTLLP